MAAYPPGPSRLMVLADLAGGQAPGDWMYILDTSVGIVAGDPSDRRINLNDLFETITKNITAKTLIFEDALALRSISAVNTGKFDYNATAQSFQVSENGGAYQNLLKGSGTATRVTFWVAADEVSSDAAFYWQNVDKRLGIGVGSTPDGPLDILADGSALAQQWRGNTGPMRVQMIMDTVPEASLGTSTNHTFHLLSNNLQRVTVENGGRVGINKASLVQAQLQVVSQDDTTETLILNSAPTPLVNIAEFYNDNGLRFSFEPSGILTLGLAGGSGATGQLTFAVNGQANTQTLRGGTAPANTNAFLWPNADPTLGQALTASAPAAGLVTLSWTTIAATAPGAPANSVQYNNAGAFGGNAGFLYIPGSTTGSELALASATITSGNVFSIAATGTVAAGNTKTGLNVATSGANGTATQSTFGIRVSNTSTGTTSSNFGIDISVSGGTNNYGLRSDAAVIAIGNGFTNAVQGGAAITFQLQNNRLGMASGGVISWAPATGYSNYGDVINVADLSILRAAIGVLRVGNNSTGAGAVLIAPSTATVTGNLTVLPDNAATATTVTVARLGVNSTGTPTAPSGAAIGFGPTLSWSAETSTTPDTEAGRDAVFWLSPTHASRTSSHSWSLVNNAVLTETMRLAVPAVASPFCLSLFDGTAPNVWTAGAYGAKLYLIGTTLPAVGVCAHFGNTTIDTAQWQFLRGRGTNASPTAVQNADVMGDLEWWGQTNTATNNVVAGARIRVAASETWSAGNNGCDMFFYVSNNAGTITDRMILARTGTLRIGATSGSFSTTNKLQVGNFASWNTDVVAAFHTEADATRGLEIIGTATQTGQLFRVFAASVSPDYFSISGIGLGSIIAGTGPVQANIGGVLFVNSGQVANTSTTETNLMTYTLQDDTLAVNNSYVRWENWGTFQVSANNKRLRAYIDNTVLFDTGALGFSAAAVATWRLVLTIVRTGATAQKVVAQFISDDALMLTEVQLTTGAEDLATDLVIKLTGQGGASDEIFQEGMIVEWSPQPNS